MNQSFASGLRALCLTATALTASGVAANELPNPGFENSSTWNTGANHQIVSSNARSGTNALQVTSTGSNHDTFSDKISASSGDEFVYDAYVKAQNLVAGPNGAGDTPIAFIRFRDGNGYVLNGHGRRTEGYRWAPYPAGVGTYDYTNQQMQLRFQMTQTGDAIDVGIRSWMHNTSGKTWWDDISVTKLSFPDRGALLATYQAENADSITNSFVDDEENEYTGSGYVDVTANNALLTFNNVQGGGERVISVRYSWEGFVRPITLTVNGAEIDSKTATATGRRGVFATMDFITTLPAGNNTIRLKVGKGGGDLGQPMIDKFDVYEKSGGGGGPQPPAAPTNVQASDSTFTTKVGVTWSAANSATSYSVYRDTSTTGPGTLLGSPSGTSFDDTSAVAGTTYQYRVQACNSAGCGAFSNWDAGTRATSGGGGNPSLSVVASSGQANTSISDGASDFLKLGATEVRMANVPAQIFAVTGIGSTSGNPYTRAVLGQQWQNGTPTLSGNNVKTGLRVFNNGKGLSFTAAAGTGSRNLRIWITSRGTSSEALSATLTASLSDGSAADVTSVISQQGTSPTSRLITLTYTAATEGQLLTVELVKNGGSWIAIDAVSMIGGTGGTTNQPPTFDPVGPQTITEGDALFFNLLATDPEGMNITLTKTDDLPGAPAVLTDSGNGIGSINWPSAQGDAGSYTLTVTAEDADSQSSSIDIDVNVLPMGGGNGSLSASASSGQANTSISDGASDFLKLGATEVRMANVPAQIFAVTGIGSTSGNPYTRAVLGQQWQNGTPTLSGNNVKTGLRVFNNGKGLSFTAAAGTGSRNLRIWITSRGTSSEALSATLTASLSDGSAADVTSVISQQGTLPTSRLITLTYTAATEGQLLTVELVKNGGSWIAIDAVSMIGGTGGTTNQPPTFDPVGPQTITEGDALFFNLLATDPEGMNITLTKTDDLPGAPAVLTDSGNGIGSINWPSAQGDAGSYTLTVTAEDADSQSSSIDIDVNVLPMGGGNGSLSASATRVTQGTITLAGSYIKYAPTTSIDEAFNTNGAQPFSVLTRLSGAVGARSPTSTARYNYTGATPANGSGVRGGNRIFDPAPVGMSITIDADASAQSAIVYVGAKDVIARAIISLSDSSAAPVILDIDRRGAALATYAIDIDFQAASANQTVEVQLFLHELTDDGVIGWTQFEAAQQ